MRRVGLALALLAFCAQMTALSVPLLQLDIKDGVYDSDPDAENIVATSNPFTLYALFNTRKGKISGTYYLAVAIVPKTDQGPPPTDFGSFKVNNDIYSSANMLWGNPPAAIIHSKFDLPAHGIYDTHYFEIGFMFDKNRRADRYNSQDNPGGLVESAGGALVFEDFEVDVSGLAAGFQVHFDLYNVVTDKRGKLKVKDFAPFSHDAQSGAPPSVADTSSTMILLGIAMLAVEGLRRRFLR